MKERRYSAGELVFREGEQQATMYEIQRGSVGVVRDYGTENETLLTLLKAGKLFGEMGLIEGAPRSATVVAREDDTVLEEISEEEFYSFFQNKPGHLLQLLRQLSARIRENTQTYEKVCRALAACETAGKDRPEKLEALSRALAGADEEVKVSRPARKGLRSSFYTQVQEDLAAMEGKRQIVRANPIERFTVRRIDAEEMHVNPDDEFADPEIGPSDRIINEYAQEIQTLWTNMRTIFPEPIVVYKLKPKDYLILNGHHRWAAALKCGFGKLNARIINPPK